LFACLLAFRMSLSRSTQASASVFDLSIRSRDHVAIPDTDEEADDDSPLPSPVRKKRKTPPRKTRSDDDDDDDFVSVSPVSSEYDEVASPLVPPPTPLKKRGRPKGTRNTKLKSISLSALPSTTRKDTITDPDEFEEVLRELTQAQPAVPLSHIHPRNKDKANKQSMDVIGRVYNAHRMRALSRTQLGFLKQKLDEIGSVIKPDGCWVANAGKKSRATFADPDAQKRPRGLMLDTEHKGVLGKQTFELVQIQLFAAGVYPRTSEDEASHLCHNNFCINPDHIIWELHPDNHDRDRCRHTRDILCPNCACVFTICDHKPECRPCTCVVESECVEEE